MKNKNLEDSLSEKMDTALLEKIEELVFYDNFDPKNTIEVLQEAFTIRGRLSSCFSKQNNNYLGRFKKYLTKFMGILNPKYSSVKNSLKNNSPATNRDYPHVQGYAQDEEKKTLESLKRIVSKGIYSQEEAERIFNKIYNSHYNKT